MDQYLGIILIDISYNLKISSGSGREIRMDDALSKGDDLTWIPNLHLALHWCKDPIHECKYNEGFIEQIDEHGDDIGPGALVVSYGTVQAK